MSEKIGYQGIYLERAGVNAGDLVRKLQELPERPLDDHDRQDALAFEKVLADYELKSKRTMADVIRGSKGEDVVAPIVFTEPFTSGDVQSDAIDMPKFDSANSVLLWFAERAVDPSIDKSKLKKLIARAADDYKWKVADALVQGVDVDVDTLSYSPIVMDVEQANNDGRDLYESRQVLLGLRSTYSESDISDLDAAKRAIVDVYLGRINDLIAKQVPITEYIKEQAELLKDDGMYADALSIVPSGLRSAIVGKARGALFRRLDFLRNGMGLANGSASVVAGEAIDDAEAIADTDETVRARYTPEQIKKLKEYMLTPDRMLALMEGIMSKANMLSAEKVESPEAAVLRSGRAFDELFQVIINPGKGSFAVDNIRGLYKVSKTSRSLYEFMTIGGAHELTHVNQGIANKELGNELRIAELRGRRISMLSEGGADAVQRAYEKKLSGTSKPIALTYAHALEALESGGSVFDATKAFYNEKIRTHPDIDKHRAAFEAADRTLRLVRMGGISSQPMAYAEEGILMREIEGLDDSGRARAAAITALDFVDQVRLHCYGLLPESKTKPIDWIPLIEEELIGEIEEALAK